LPNSESSRTGKRRIVYLMGPAHSGTTLLSLLLSMNPDICTIGELKATSRGEIRSYKCSCGEYILECPFWVGVKQAADSQGIRFDLENFGTHFVGNGVMSDKLLYSSLRGPAYESVRDFFIGAIGKVEVFSDQVRNTNRALVEILMDRMGGCIFLDGSKDPIRLKYLSQIPEWDIKVIHMVRDGRATAYSYMKNYGITMERAAKEWRQTCSEFPNIERFIDPKSIYFTRYEDLCMDQSGVLIDIFKFLGVENDLSDSDFSKQHILGNSMRLTADFNVKMDNRWKNALSSGDIDCFLRIAGDLNGRYGYQ